MAYSYGRYLIQIVFAAIAIAAWMISTTYTGTPCDSYIIRSEGKERNNSSYSFDSDYSKVVYCQMVRKSTMFSELCNNTPPTYLEESTVYPLLITGTPRSGTVFVANMMNRLGVKLANDGQVPSPEKYKHGMVSWVHIFKEPYNNLVWIKKQSISQSKFKTVWHQVRDPLKSITSIAFSEPLLNKRFSDYLERHITLSTMPMLLAYEKNRRAMQYHNYTPFNSTLDTETNSFIKVYRGIEFYLEWHEFLIAIKVPVFRLEDLMGSPDETYSTLVRLLQSIDMKPPNRTEISSVMGNDIGTNSRKHRDTLSWSELCYVHTGMTKRLLQMSQGWGYYKEKDTTTIC